MEMGFTTKLREPTLVIMVKLRAVLGTLSICGFAEATMRAGERRLVLVAVELSIKPMGTEFTQRDNVMAWHVHDPSLGSTSISTNVLPLICLASHGIYFTLTATPAVYDLFPYGSLHVTSSMRA